ncbi:MAG TPA: lycopene cyclase family protein [Arenibacter sp.]|nr:lycopene cyclase family protein [Arenibacter sp.]
MPIYDYIIIGAGAAGLLLADGLGKDPYFANSSILVLDRNLKQKNDRTWCFWEVGKGDFDSLVHKSWNHIYFADKSFSKTMPIAPYTYKMIKSIDFYRFYKDRIATYPNIKFSTGTVNHIWDDGTAVTVKTGTKIFKGRKVFNSIFDYAPLHEQKKYPVLQQHFLGWFVKTSKPVFHVDRATFMDFSVSQGGNTRFMYMLPLSSSEALIEYTLFSKNVLPTKEYETEIATYLQDRLNCSEYEIWDKEKGNIPMSCYNFNIHNSKNLINIGIAGGWTKPSSGYTFMRTHKKIQKLIQFLKKDSPLNHFFKKNRFWYYDLLLVDVLDHDNSKGQTIFGNIFRRCPPQTVFKFLDEDSNIWEDLKIIAACPKKEFILALLRRIF